MTVRWNDHGETTAVVYSNPLFGYARSVGHVGFVADTHGSHWEYWVRGDSVYRQNVAAPVMPDGYRSGRWFAYATDSVVGNLRKVTS